MLWEKAGNRKSESSKLSIFDDFDFEGCNFDACYFVRHDVFDFEVCNFDLYDFVREDVFDLSYLNSEQLVLNMHNTTYKFYSLNQKASCTRTIYKHVT